MQDKIKLKIKGKKKEILYEEYSLFLIIVFSFGTDMSSFKQKTYLGLKIRLTKSNTTS